MKWRVEFLQMRIFVGEFGEPVHEGNDGHSRSPEVGELGDRHHLR